MSVFKENKEKDKRHYVEDRLLFLKKLKDKYGLQTKAAQWKVKANLKEVNTPGDDDYRTQIGTIVKLQKDAEYASAFPEYEFIPENEAGRRNRRIVKELWGYWWNKSKSDKEISKTIQSATTYGTGVIYEGIRHFYKEINVPFYNESGDIEFVTRKKLIYSGIYCERIPFENFFINGDDIDNSTEAVIIRYFDKDAYISEKKGDKRYKNISKLKHTVKDQTFSTNTSGEDIKPSGEEKDVVTEITYYNSAKDEHIILANGVEILKSHIPYTHKEIPVCLFIDNKADDRIWGIGEYEMTEQDERTKNELRTLMIKAVKASIGFILKDRDNEFEEDDMRFGVGEVYEVSDIDGIKHFAPTAPIEAIIRAEQKVDNDIIIKTGMDINSLQTTTESATKTAGKSVSSRKRINKNIKDNAYDFYKRLAYLRMKNIQFLHTLKVREIPIKGGSIRNDGVFRKDDSKSFGSAKIGGEMVKGDFMVEPLIESMLGNNRLKRKSNILEFAQVAGSIPGEDGRPIIKGQPLVESIAEEFELDYDRLTQTGASLQSGASALDAIDKEGSGISTDATNPMSPEFIPPEQRSGAAKQVSTISGQAKISPEELLAE